MDFILFVCIIVVVGARVINFVKYVYENEKCLKESSPDEPIYIDARGKPRFKKTNEICSIVRNDKGERIIRSSTTLEELYNITKEKNKKKLAEIKERSIREGRKAYCVDLSENKDQIVKGRRYKDFKTGRIYIVRKIDSKVFYIDLETLEIVDYVMEKYSEFKNLDKEEFDLRFYKKFLAEGNMRYIYSSLNSFTEPLLD